MFQMVVSQWLRWFSASFMLAGFLGCGGAPAPNVPPLVPVSGEVTLDGKPAEGIRVYFNPREDTKGQGSFAVTDASGKFTCEYANGEKGCAIGKYWLSFSKLTMPDGSPLPEGVMAATAGAIDKIPQRYRMPERLDGLVNIEKETSDLKFALKSK